MTENYETSTQVDVATALLCLEVKSITIGYRVLQKITGIESLRVLEAAPAGDRFMILAIGPQADLELAHATARESLDSVEKEQWIDAEILKECEPSLVQAIYHLPQVPARESLIIADCATVSGLLAVAQSLVHGKDIAVIEIKIKRSGSGAYAFFTGPTDVCGPAAEEARTKLKRAIRVGSIEVVESMTPKFREFFNLSGQE